MAKEFVEREALLNVIRNNVAPMYYKDCLKCIAEAPAADVVEVVRCEDCKYWAGIDEFGDGLCNNPFGLDDTVQSVDFCSYGKRGYGNETD